ASPPTWPRIGLSPSCAVIACIPTTATGTPTSDASAIFWSPGRRFTGCHRSCHEGRSAHYYIARFVVRRRYQVVANTGLRCAMGVNAGGNVVASISGRAQGGGTADIRGPLRMASVSLELALESVLFVGLGVAEFRPPFFLVRILRSTQYRTRLGQCLLRHTCQSPPRAAARAQRPA